VAEGRKTPEERAAAKAERQRQRALLSPEEKAERRAAKAERRAKRAQAEGASPPQKATKSPKADINAKRERRRQKLQRIAELPAAERRAYYAGEEARRAAAKLANGKAAPSSD